MSTCEITSALWQSPGLPKSTEGDPVFGEPWHAQAFAMTVHLHERGLFSWGEWAKSLSDELHRPGRAADGSDYFDGWVAALTTLLAAKGLAETETVLSLQESWKRAAEATPHGSPIVLANDPLRCS
ncbi:MULTISPECIES: nitrile hydratase accessory protein [Alphaproteobacteria]|uniref:Nitrile hydratase accessory protein n=2 Tax=Alphaproteobacteria TaxID=28211 RepID=A0A512HMU8_9HYPH|nr:MULTISPECIES: nitrile hydratase accessory protein [Alphaproteobacteria]GEO86776.1 nitrile hydratase accessory protein [Ciceribacter naphthalenivorans]GLR23355.1 nitrile hydratase accessory protein [Ciceribacter naphthalenivorans]GLT06211.1 nitrile hydratase accessory protein [Sphingomonas psychrolutea]